LYPALLVRIAFLLVTIQLESSTIQFLLVRITIRELSNLIVTSENYNSESSLIQLLLVRIAITELSNSIISLIRFLLVKIKLESSAIAFLLVKTELESSLIIIVTSNNWIGAL